MFEIPSIRKQTIFILAVLILAAVGIGMVMADGYGEIQATIVVLALIGVLAFFLLPRLVHREEKKFLPKILFWGLIARIAGVFFRIYIDFGMGVLVSDSIGYMRNGAYIAEYLWHFQFSEVVPFFEWGVPFIQLITGVIFSFVGITQYGGYLVYGLIAFFSSYFYYRAFSIAFPDQDKRLYAVLVFFLPSILFWVNGISKDALIAFFISLSAYGGARYLVQHKLGGLPVMVFGLMGVFYIRPHITFLLAVALFAGYLFQGIRHKNVRNLSFYVVVVAAGLAIILLVPRIASLIGVPGLSIAEVFNYLNSRQDLTAIGGSTFAPVNISNPINIPYLIVTVLFRPFPWEAHNFQAIIQSVEGIMLLAIVVWRLNSIKKALYSSVSNGYILFILVYFIAFIVTFSTVQNFGILARQRTMLFPLLFMLFALLPSSSQTDTEITEKAKLVVANNSE